MVERSNQSDDTEAAGSSEGSRATGEGRGNEMGDGNEESERGGSEGRSGKSRVGDGGQQGSKPGSPSDERFDEELPKYLWEGLAKQDVGTLRVARRYIDALIDRKRRAVAPDELPENASPVNETADGYIVEEYVRCGKDNCACTSGAESNMHGPYEYRYYRDDDGSLHKEYVDNE